MVFPSINLTYTAYIGEDSSILRYYFNVWWYITQRRTHLVENQRLKPLQDVQDAISNGELSSFMDAWHQTGYRVPTTAIGGESMNFRIWKWRWKSVTCESLGPFFSIWTSESGVKKWIGMMKREAFIKLLYLRANWHAFLWYGPFYCKVDEFTLRTNISFSQPALLSRWFSFSPGGICDRSLEGSWGFEYSRQ